MKHSVKISILILTFLGTISSGIVQAQGNAAAVKYMDYIGKQLRQISQDVWNYTNAVARGKTARTVENKRKELIKQVAEAQNKVSAMEDFEGDVAYRDSVVSFLKLNYLTLTYDYAKIVDMEEIAEQSYDNMEAYLTAKELVDEKMEIAEDMLQAQQNLFAQNHGVNLVESKDKLYKKLEKAGKVMNYYNDIYLIFFKSFKQEYYMLEAMNRQDINGIEQNKTALIGTADVGIKALPTVKNINSDPSLKNVCKEILTFYQMEAKTKIPEIVNFNLKRENFEKVKNAFESKSTKTKADSDQYNKAVNEYNNASTKFNQVNEELNQKRNALLEKWNKTVDVYLDKHVPKNK